MSTFLGIWWLWWAIGTFGVVGTALMLWLAPALLAQILAWCLNFFIRTRAGNIILAAAVAFYVADVNRSLRDQHEFAARTAAFREAQHQRDKDIAHQTRETVLRELAAQSVANIKIDKDVEEFTNAFPPVPPLKGADPLRVGDASCKLRALAGYTGCGPERPQRVSKARSASTGPGPGHRPRFKLPALITRGPGGAQESE